MLWAGKFGWKKTRASIHGTHRAAFWAKLGYPNLKKGTATFVRNCQLRKAAASLTRLEKQVDDDTRKAELASALDAIRRIKGG